MKNMEFLWSHKLMKGLILKKPLDKLLRKRNPNQSRKHFVRNSKEFSAITKGIYLSRLRS